MASSSSEPKTIDLTADDGEGGTPGKKKLKQMRLPFKIIDKNEVKTKPNTNTPTSEKKRKISENTAAEDTTTPSKKERTGDGPGTESGDTAPVVRAENVEKKTPKRITPTPVPRDEPSPAAAKTPRRIQPTLISSSPSVRPATADAPAQETPKAKKRIALQPADGPAPPAIQETKNEATAPTSASSWVENTLLDEEELASGDKKTPDSSKVDTKSKASEKKKSSIKSLISSIPVKTVPVPADSSAVAEEEVEETKAKNDEDDQVEILDEEKGLSPEVVLSVGDKISVSYKDGNRYDAKIIKWKKEDGASCQFLVHYQGWNVRHDEWIERSRIVELGWSKPDDEVNQTPATPTPSSSASAAVSSPAVIEDRKQKVRVAIAKLKVTIHELNDEMDKAAEKREFLKAAEVKAKIDARTKEREELEGVLERSGSDVEKMEAALREVANSSAKKQSPGTPKSSAKKTPSSGAKKRAVLSVATPGSGSAPATPKSGGSANPTPKQLAKREEAAKKKEEREKAKAEKDRQKAEEKLAKDRKREAEKKAKEEEKLEKDRLKEEEKMKKEQEKKAKEEEKLEKQRQKAEEQKVKQEEKERKAEEQRLKQEEREKKAEEKRRQEEAEAAKAQKAKAAFSSFFVKKSPEEKAKVAAAAAEEERQDSKFSQFIVKKNMRLTPASRTDFGAERRLALERTLGEDGAPGGNLYLTILKSGGYEVGRLGKTWPADEVKKDEDDEVEIVDEDDEEALLDDSGAEKTLSEEEELKPKRVRAKLLQFCENQRPPYWGTWTKRSKSVGPRRPFGQDKEAFDYEYDSDDDWEEEPAEGESLSDEEKDKEDEETEEERDAEEEDDGFFVGHGVLDKDEILAGDDDDEEGGVIEYDEELEMKKQKMRAQQFEEEYKNKGRKKKPMKKRVFGPVWMADQESGAGAVMEVACEQLIRILKPYRAINLLQGGGQIPTARSSPAPSPSEAAASAKVTPKSGKKKKEKAATAGEGTPKSSRKRKDKSEKAASGEKSSTPKSGKADGNAPVNERSSIKTLISNIPVKRKIKPVPAPADSSAAAAEDEVEIIKEVAKDKVEAEAKVEVTKAEETGQEKEKDSTSVEKAPAAPSIKSFFSTIPVKRKAAAAAESGNGALAKQTRCDGEEEEAKAATKRDDQTES